MTAEVIVGLLFFGGWILLLCGLTPIVTWALDRWLP